MKKLYLGTQNDGLYIIDQPPSPAPCDYPNHDVGGNVFAKICGASREDQAIAERMVAAYNATLETR